MDSWSLTDPENFYQRNSGVLMTSSGQEPKGIKIRKNSRRGEVWDSCCIKKIIV